MDTSRFSIRAAMAWCATTTLALSLAAMQIPAAAQGMIRYDQKYLEAIKKDSTITPLTVDSFGDTIDLASGGTTFRWTDIDIPGNNALPVRLQRTLVVEDKVLGGSADLGGFGGGQGLFSLDIPYLKGIFTTNGWQVSGSSPNARCTAPSSPPSNTTNIQSADFWSGNTMHVPWAGDQTMLYQPASSLPLSSASSAKTLVTTGFWTFQCKGSTANGYPGEAFIAVSPQGEKYYFDWAVTKPYAGLSKRYGNLATSVAKMNRQLVMFLVTRIEDRFGNWVTYTYSGDKLQKITASDGRYIQVDSWNGDNIAAVSSSVGNWSYAYTPTSLVTTQPDGQHWTYVANGSLTITAQGSVAQVDPNHNCPAPDFSSGNYALAVTQPSGATATYVFEVQRHIENGVPKQCAWFPSVTGQTYDFYLEIPYFSDTFTLTSKTISGPGLSTMQWTYVYAGGSGPATQDVCNTSCVPTRTTEVRGPDSIFKRYTFGNIWGRNSGQLLQVEEGSTTGSGATEVVSIQKTTTNNYFNSNNLSSAAFPGYVGTPGSYSRLDWVKMAALRPMVATQISQDGALFTTLNSNFDVFGRPTQVTRMTGAQAILSPSTMPGPVVAPPPSPPAVPAVPVLMVPYEVTARVAFQVKWLSVGNATEYVLETNRNTAAFTAAYDGTDTTILLTVGVQGTQNYRLKACNSAGCSDYTTVQSVIIDPNTGGGPGGPVMQSITVNPNSSGSGASAPQVTTSQGVGQ